MLAVGADGDGWDDGDERGRFGRELAETERGEGGDEEDAAADAEQPARMPAAMPAARAATIVRVSALEPAAASVPSPSSIQSPIATSSAANAKVRLRAGIRCCNAVPKRTPPTAGMPTSAARAKSTSPSIAYSVAPTVAVITIAASEVPVASRAGKPASIISSGTATMPPPTPNSELNSPATRPIATILRSAESNRNGAVGFGSASAPGSVDVGVALTFAAGRYPSPPTARSRRC